MLRALLIAIALALAPEMATATPAPPYGATDEGGNLVTKIHGGHRHRCRYGPTLDGRGKIYHRHVKETDWSKLRRGFQNRVERCKGGKRHGKRWRGHGSPPDWRRRGCWKKGRMWYCP